MARGRNLVPQLVELTGATAGRVHSLTYGEHVLGRGGGVNIHLDDADVSRRHARLLVEHQGVRVFDLGSKNGVFAQGVRIEGSSMLTHGQTLSIGDLRLRVNHPASQLNRALAQVGETTATAARDESDGPQRPTRGLLIPILGVFTFASLVVAMLTR